MNNAVKIIIKSIVFIVCLGLIIVGQKNISLTGLAMELIGLVGLLVFLSSFVNTKEALHNMQRLFSLLIFFIVKK